MRSCSREVIRSRTTSPSVSTATASSSRPTPASTTRSRSASTPTCVVGDLDSVDPAALRDRVRPRHDRRASPRARRTRPISSSRSTPRGRGDVRRVRWSAATADGSTICSPTLLLLASPRFADARDRRAASARTRRGGPATRRRCSAASSELCTLAARRRRRPTASGPAACAIPLDGEHLEPGSTRGVSNVFVETDGDGDARFRRPARHPTRSTGVLTVARTRRTLVASPSRWRPRP